jgi:LEA14-like dessication related protein
MKNLLFAGGAVAALIYFLRQKKAAGQNLKIQPLDIAIDTARSRQSRWLNIFYNLKLKLINTENASVNVSNITFDVFINNIRVGNVNRKDKFVVKAQSEQIVNIESSINTIGIANLILNLIQEGFKFDIKIAGFVDTDLGRLNLNFSKNFDF